MKILIHSHEYFPYQGPCSIRMKSFADELINQGHEVTVLCGKHNLMYGEKEETSDNLNIKYTYCTKIGKKTTLQRLMNNVSFALSSLLVAFDKKIKPDIVITTSPPPLISMSGWLIAKVKNARLVYDVRDIWPDVAIEMEMIKKNSCMFKVFNLISKFMFNHSDLVISVTLGKVKKLQLKYPNAIIRLVSNGILDEFLQNEIDMNLVHEYDLDKTFNVVYIGNVGLAQRTESIIELAKKYKFNNKIRFFIIGDGKQKEFLKIKCKEEQIKNLTFLDPIANEKVFTVLKYSEISFVSLKNSKMTDSIPTKIYEAFACGCPVFLIGNGDSAELLKEFDFGFCVSCEDMDYVSTFDYMLSNYQELYSKEKKKHVESFVIERYSRKKIAEKLIKIIKEEI